MAGLMSGKPFHVTKSQYRLIRMYIQPERRVHKALPRGISILPLNGLSLSSKLRRSQQLSLTQLMRLCAQAFIQARPSYKAYLSIMKQTSCSGSLMLVGKLANLY